MTDANQEEEFKPFVAPCKNIELSAPLRWLSLGWNDYKRAYKASILYGLVVVIISYLVFIVAWVSNSFTLAIGLLSAFIFIAPVLCIGLYSISMQLRCEQEIDFIKSIKHGFTPYGDLSIYFIVVIVIALVWARAASMIHIFFPIGGENDIAGLVTFLGIGSAIGSIFAIIIYSVSVFSLPMIMDKKVDMITACISSVNAVLRNKKSMFFWAFLIVFLTSIGILTAFIGFLVIIPLLGYATWHGYRESLDVSEWDDRITEFSTIDS